MIDVADSNSVYYYHYDGLGSVVALSDSNGDTVQTYEYSIYGQVAAEYPNFLTNPYLFTGRRFDIETGLYYYRARYYNPHTGRFMQTDPVGYSAGMNLYSYCRNNPLAFVDPSGLCCSDNNDIGQELLDDFWDDFWSDLLGDLDELENDWENLLTEWEDFIEDEGIEVENLDDDELDDIWYEFLDLEWAINSFSYAAPPIGGTVGAGLLGESLIELQRQKINNAFSELYPESREDLGQEYFSNKGPCQRIGEWYNELMKYYIPPTWPDLQDD